MREFMDEDVESSESEELPEVCHSLRTKNAFGTQSGYTPWQLGASSTASYWCLETMGPAGPDEQLVHPSTCCAGRTCYRARNTE
jgi:hypothetical protein